MELLQSVIASCLQAHVTLAGILFLCVHGSVSLDPEKKTKKKPKDPLSSCLEVHSLYDHDDVNKW